MPPIPSGCAFLARASPNRFFKTKRIEEERRERKEKEGRGEILCAFSFMNSKRYKPM
jgi:hypothetical protein